MLVPGSQSLRFKGKGYSRHQPVHDVWTTLQLTHLLNT